MPLINPRLALHCCAFIALLRPLDLMAEVLVVAGAKGSHASLSQNQVRDVFLGRVSSLPDGSNAFLIDLPESSALREEFYLKVANKSSNQAKQYWAQLYFTGGGVPPREVATSTDVKKLVNSVHGAIGYIERSALDSSVTVISVVP